MGDFAQEQEEKAAPGEHFNEVRETAQLTGEAAHELGHFKEMFPVLQGAGGIGHATLGVRQIANGQYVDGGLNVVGGVTDAAQGAAHLAGKTGVVHALDKVGPLLDGASTINDIRKGEYGDAVLDGTSTVLDYAAPELAAPWKLGTTVGKGLNHSAAEYNEYGQHRTLSEAGGETAQTFRETLEAGHGPSQDTNMLTGMVVAEKSVVNTADAALTSIVMPPYLRDEMAKLRAASGEEGAGGIGGTGISVEDAVLPSWLKGAIPGFSSPKKQNDGPTYVEIMNQQIAQSEALMRSLEAKRAASNAATAGAVFGTDPGASPYAGMYEHTDDVRK